MKASSNQNSVPRFSKQSIAFLEKAGRQKKADWLERNQEEYEEVLLAPLQHLAQTVSQALMPLAPDYHFPKKGLGRLKRSAHRVLESGGKWFKNWISYSAARPRTSRFEHNPNLFFLINSEDDEDPVLVAGGLYMPSSKQMRLIREAIAKDARPFDQLFKTAAFNKAFPGGFSLDKTSTRVPRGFDSDHPRMKWIKLQAFFVWRAYSKKEFSSKDFAALVTQDFKQVLKFNQLLEQILQGHWTVKVQAEDQAKPLLNRLEEVTRVPTEMDF